MKGNSRPSSKNNLSVLKATSPAKINWFLKVLGKRPDGYHNIFSLMQKVDLNDILTFQETEEEKVVVENSLGIPQERDIAYRAVLCLKDSRRIKRGITIKIQKEIPPESGLGGGSSNGATVLKNLNNIWNLGLTESELLVLGASLGSDVPFFIQESAMAVVRSKGEVIRPVVVDSSGIPLLIVRPFYGISTAKVYAMLKDYSSGQYCEDLLFRTLKAFEKGDLEMLGGCLENDLERYAFTIRPELRELKAEVLASGALGALVSGSGSSVFGIFETKRKALNASRAFKDCQVFVVETI